MTTEIQALSEKLAKLYGVDAFVEPYLVTELDSGFTKLWLTEDSGRISDLADENEIYIVHRKDFVESGVIGDSKYQRVEYYKNYPSKSAAARMARVKCLIAIGEQK